MKGGEKMPQNKITQLMEMLSASLTVTVKAFLHAPLPLPLNSTSSSTREAANLAKISEAEALLRRFALFFPSAETFAQQEVEAFATRLKNEVNQ